MTIKSIGLFGNPDKEGIRSAIRFVREHCSQEKVAVLLTRKMARTTGEPDSGHEPEDLVAQVDVVVALGGDGTMLRAARAIGNTGTPLLGINLGSLGYLTDVPIEKVDQALSQLLAGQYHLEERSRVVCTAWRGRAQLVTLSALNDVVLNMGPVPRALELEVLLEGESLGRFLGDGLIVSTPTGSTAYNLSAGGPICHSTVSCLLLTPICPHSLGMRPLIVSPDIDIEVLLHVVGSGAALSADGQETHTLHNGDRLSFGFADSSVHLVKFPHSNFYRVMRHKLNWGAPDRRRDGR